MERQFVIGDYAYSSYGYDQTNISFYKVIDRKGDWVTFAPVRQNAVESGSGDYGHTIPDTNSEPNLDNKFRRKIHSSKYGESCSYARTYGGIYPYENKPVMYSWGH
jgi:hypothetical protein